jgi:Zn finger protein HypA/HybF involved in hydrogenase expression
MHDGCNGSFEDGKQVVDKVRMMGFSLQSMPIPANFKCHECDEEITMVTMEYTCPHCGMVYGVTPCHAFDINNIMAAGKNY